MNVFLYSIGLTHRSASEAEQVGRQARSHKEVKKPRRHKETEDHNLKQRVLATANTKNSSLFVCNNNWCSL